MEKWPTRDKNKTIWINEDNSKCHPDRTRLVVQDVAAVQGWDVCGRPQPANSPGMNILDLGFFHCSIQTLQYKTKPETMEELIQAVCVTFHNTKQGTLGWRRQYIQITTSRKRCKEKQDITWLCCLPSRSHWDSPIRHWRPLSVHASTNSSTTTGWWW